MKLFLLLKPRLLGLRNSLSPTRSLKRKSHRDLVFLLASLILIAFVYHASYSTFLAMRTTPHIYQLNPQTPIALLLSLLSGMIFLSGSAATIGAFYMGHDLDLLFSKPITPLQFLIGKGLEVIVQSSWMVLVFGLPALAGIGSAYGAPITFNLIALLAIVPILVIPTLIGIALISWLVHIIPPHKTREILFVGASIMILYMYMTAKDFLVDPATGEAQEISQSLQYLLAISSSRILPTSWAAELVGSYLMNPHLSSKLASQLGALYGLSIIVGLISYYFVSKLHAQSFSKIQSNSFNSKIASTKEHLRLSRLLFFISPEARALWSKEMKLFARDLTQGLQLIMLLGICLVYLYNFRVVHGVKDLNPEMLAWWQGALLLCNIAMGSFIITAVSSRFVFPSVSLEGNSFWVIRAAPLSLSKILRTKFWTWYLPIAAIASIVLMSGALAIDASPFIVIATGVLSWVMCYGLVGLAIGLGCIFAKFDWDYAPQMSSSFGNFIFMIAGTLLIFLNTIPILLMIILTTIRTTSLPFSDLQWYVAIISLCLLIIYLNFATRRFSLRLGEEALMKLG